jgi:flagellar basal body-associated protein FliL
MSDANDTAAAPVQKSGIRSLFRSWKVIVVLLALVGAIAGGAGYWYLAPRQSAQPAKDRIAAAPPFYLEVKPFVVSVATGYGATHFVELGFNLALPGSDAGNAVTAVLPEVQDAMRQTVLAFKMEDITTPAGVEKMREAMIASANHLLLRRLGVDEIKRLTGGKPDSRLVQNLFFSTLIAE